MGGCFAYTDEEIARVHSNFTGQFAFRNQSIYLVSIWTGFRASEILSLRLGDVYMDGHILSEIHVRAENMKGKNRSRTVMINDLGLQILSRWIDHLLKHDHILKRSPLWPKANGEALAYDGWYTAHKKASQAAGIYGRYRRSTHSMRKSFYHINWHQCKDNGDDDVTRLKRMQKIMGHMDVNSTIKYHPDSPTDKIVEQFGKGFLQTLIGGHDE